jgi:hypothetical protein
MEETYSPPILLNGFLSKSVDSFTPEEMNPAFKVKETKKHDFKFSLEYRIFLERCKVVELFKARRESTGLKNLFSTGLLLSEAKP